MIQERVVRDAEATRITGLGRTRRYELARLGKFPQKIKLSDRASGYRLSELMAWLESRPRSNEAAQ